MTEYGRARIAIIICAATLCTPAWAHEKKAVGRIQLTIGWGAEPVFSGSQNSVEVRVSDPTGAPIVDPAGSLGVEVSFGDQRITLPLLPSSHPGMLEAAIVPTRAGAYTFHISGTLKGQAIDTTSTCSDKTFDCVVDSSAIQFPAKDPSAGELADRIGRAMPRAERAIDAARSARTLAVAALAAAALALAMAIGAAVRTGSRGA
jgi:hypothetical protein